MHYRVCLLSYMLLLFFPIFFICGLTMFIVFLTMKNHFISIVICIHLSLKTSGF